MFSVPDITKTYPACALHIDPEEFQVLNRSYRVIHVARHQLLNIRCSKTTQMHVGEAVIVLAFRKKEGRN